MATATVAPPQVETVADLLEKLGIPPERIRLQPPPGLATEDDVIHSKARYNRLCELIDGVLVEKPMGYYESRLGFVLGYYLEKYLENNDLGIAIGADGMVRVDPGQVRLPDVSFFPWDWFPDRRLPPGSILDLTPLFAVEILSPTNTRREMARKRREYFAGGGRLVWEVDPERQTVEVFTAPETSTVFTAEQTLDATPVLPGFTVSIAQWFARAGQR